MPSQLGKYTLIRTLGTGANSKVKLALDKATGQYFAIKILKKDDPSVDTKFIELVMTEVQAMEKLSCPNIVNLLEYSQESFVEKADGRKLPVIHIVLELATGGELFDYVATTGRFSEGIARFYFQQMMAGLEYVHKAGITHRDMKPENVLFDSNFNLKIADFGFAAPIDGKDHSGLCKTKLGTESYMAPEIHMRKPYNGASVDLFASAIILFIMVTQHPPFTRAEPKDPFYRLIAANRPDLFWRAHQKSKPAGFFSEEFQQMITSMLALDPEKRLTIEQLKTHPWITGPTATIEDIQQEFALRKQKIDQEAETKRQQKEAAKMDSVAYGARRVYRGLHDVEDEEMKDEEVKESDIVASTEKKAIDDYLRIVHRNTEFFSTYDPEILLGMLTTFTQEQEGIKIQVAKDKYKAKLNVPSQAGDLELKVQVLKVNEEKYCIEFNRVSGDQIEFFNTFNNIKGFYGAINDAAF